MLFNSTTFAIFFVIVYGIYWLLHRSYRWQNLLLLAASYFFYGWWDIRFLFLIVVSTVVDYSCTLSIDNLRMTIKQRIKAAAFVLFATICFVTLRWDAVNIAMSGLRPCLAVDLGSFFPSGIQDYWILLSVVLIIILLNIVYPLIRSLGPDRSRKVFLFLSVFINLLILGVFKYYNFFADSFASTIQNCFGVTVGMTTLNIVLPVGISFYTFQTMSHTIDVYRKKMAATSSLLEVATYVSFFPQLVAGPIERGQHLLPQFQRKRSVTAFDFRYGVWLIAWGLYKKIVVADNLAKIVNSTFAPFDTLSSAFAVPEDGMRLLVAVYAVAFQIYCDFSGYTDIARGSAKLLGFDVMVNFNLPYFAKNPSDFWKRWHISLSTWLRDYLYIPLGGNRGGNVKLCRNLMLTMLLGGLWHGASWTFVIWGGFHGLILVLYRMFTHYRKDTHQNVFYGFIQAIVMFNLVCLGWLLFRAQNLQAINTFLESIILHPHWSVEAVEAAKKLVFYVWFLVLFQVLQGTMGTLNPMQRWPWFVRLNVWLFVIMSLLSLAVHGSREFIYFAF